VGRTLRVGTASERLSDALTVSGELTCAADGFPIDSKSNRRFASLGRILTTILEY